MSYKKKKNMYYKYYNLSCKHRTCLSSIGICVTSKTMCFSSNTSNTICSLYKRGGIVSFFSRKFVIKKKFPPPCYLFYFSVTSSSSFFTFFSSPSTDLLPPFTGFVWSCLPLLGFPGTWKIFSF